MEDVLDFKLGNFKRESLDFAAALENGESGEMQQANLLPAFELPPFDDFEQIKTELPEYEDLDAFALTHDSLNICNSRPSHNQTTGPQAFETLSNDHEPYQRKRTRTESFCGLLDDILMDELKQSKQLPPPQFQLPTQTADREGIEASCDALWNHNIIARTAVNQTGSDIVDRLNHSTDHFLIESNFSNLSDFDSRLLLPATNDSGPPGCPNAKRHRSESTEQQVSQNEESWFEPTNSTFYESTKFGTPEYLDQTPAPQTLYPPESKSQYFSKSLMSTIDSMADLWTQPNDSDGFAEIAENNFIPKNETAEKWDVKWEPEDNPSMSHNSAKNDSSIHLQQYLLPLPLEVHPPSSSHRKHSMVSGPRSSRAGFQRRPNRPDHHGLGTSLLSQSPSDLLNVPSTPYIHSGPLLSLISCQHTEPPCALCLHSNGLLHPPFEKELLRLRYFDSSFLYRLPRSPTARAAIVHYPHPPVPAQHLPRLRHSYQQALFDQFARSESDPMRIQLGHFIVEHCTRSIPEEYLRTDATPNPRIVTDFVDQIILAVEIFGEHAQYDGARDSIPTDINEMYISQWLQQKTGLLKPLEILHRRRQKKLMAETTSDATRRPRGRSDADDPHRRDSKTSKVRRKIGVSLGEELDNLGVPRMIHFENLREAISHRGLVVQLPSNGSSSSSSLFSSFFGEGKSMCHRYGRLLFNLLIAGRGDTRRSKMELPWGTTVKIKYNRTLLGIPDFVVEGLGYGASGPHHLIPKVCAVSLEDSAYGVEILLFYRGLPCNKRMPSHRKHQHIPHMSVSPANRSFQYSPSVLPQHQRYFSPRLSPTSGSPHTNNSHFLHAHNDQNIPSQIWNNTNHNNANHNNTNHNLQSGTSKNHSSDLFGTNSLQMYGQEAMDYQSPNPHFSSYSYDPPNQVPNQEVPSQSQQEWAESVFQLPVLEDALNPYETVDLKHFLTPGAAEEKQPQTGEDNRSRQTPDPHECTNHPVELPSGGSYNNESLNIQTDEFSPLFQSHSFGRSPEESDLARLLKHPTLIDYENIRNEFQMSPGVSSLSNFVSSFGSRLSQDVQFAPPHSHSAFHSS